MSKDKVSTDQTDVKETDIKEVSKNGNDVSKDNTSVESSSPKEDAKGDKEYDELKEELAKKEAEAAEYLDTLKRVQAEMENYRKRMQKEQEQIIQHATQTVILELLPVIDNLERALDTGKAENESGKLYEGVELIYSQLKRILERECVEIIDPVNEKFDPMRHEAVMQIESEEHEANTVAQVMQKGYELKGRLLRPAMVVVAK